MSSLHDTAREDKPPRQPRSRVAIAAAAYDVRHFCDAHSVSRSALYRLWKEGTGPRYFKVGNKIFISCEAASEWRAAMEDATADARKQAAEADA